LKVNTGLYFTVFASVWLHLYSFISSSLINPYQLLLLIQALGHLFVSNDTIESGVCLLGIGTTICLVSATRRFGQKIAQNVKKIAQKCQNIAQNGIIVINTLWQRICFITMFLIFRKKLLKFEPDYDIFWAILNTNAP
jgi:hypothetical protein